jgi:hypothetical protein
LKACINSLCRPRSVLNCSCFFTIPQCLHCACCGLVRPFGRLPLPQRRENRRRKFSDSLHIDTVDVLQSNMVLHLELPADLKPRFPAGEVNFLYRLSKNLMQSNNITVQSICTVILNLNLCICQIIKMPYSGIEYSTAAFQTALKNISLTI